MVNDKYVVKYLDPRTGKYEYATIKDVGDLQKLNTKVKTSIVDAINSISTDGIGGLRDDLNAIGETIKSLEDGTLELGDFQSIDDVVSREIEDAINSLKLENSGLLQLTQEEINKIVSNAESEYRDNIATSIRELETSKTDLVAAREKMITIGKMLENANIDYSNLTQVVDNINLYITDIIEKTDFDMVNGIVSDYKTAVTQTQDGWGVDASKNMLSYLTGRVKSNETSLNVQHGLIEAKVGKDEFQYMTVDNLPAGKENMLHNTSDLRDWDFSSAFIFKSADDYRFTSIVQSDSAGENITGTTDELEQGVTYAISTYVNVQNKNKEPGQEKYAPTDGLYTATVIIDGDTIELNNVVEDNSALDGWKRVSGTFIAKRTAKQDIKFYVTAFNRDTQVGYLSAPKFEKGSSATSWVPHIEDNVSTMLSQNAVMRVLSDRITSSVEEVRETKDAFETATSTFDQMADGFELNTNKLTEVLDKYGEVTGVQTQQASELKVLNESITSKVWKQDINTTIDTINIDTSNRIVNSAFNIYSYDELTGALKLDYWDNNTGFAIKKHSQSLDNYLYATRSGATSVNPISIKSSPFALRDGEKILFNFEYLAVGNPLDNDNVFTLEMYDNNDVRVGLQEFRLSELKKEFLTAYDVGDSYKYNGTYIVKNSSVVKGTITLKLPKNGELWLTKVMLQNAGIGTIGWTPSSVDNQIIQSKLSTEINQLADSIELVATDERLDAINGLLVKKDGKVVISPEAIISRVTSQELGENGLITQTSLKQTEDNLRFDLVDKDGIIQTINASADGLLIDFDKVQIDGELIARMISAQSIDATQGFRLTDNNGNTLLAVVNDDGKPTLSIAKDFNVKFKDFSNKLDVTVVNVVDEYYHSTDESRPVGGQWTSAPNDFRGDTFVWKRTKVVLQSGKEYYLPDENGINITSGWNYAKGEVTNAIETAQGEADAAVQAAKDADGKANTALEKAGTNANLLTTHQNTLNTIKNTTIPNINSSISDAMAEAKSALSSASSAMDEAKAVDGKIDTFKTEVGNTISDVNNKAQKAVDDAKLVDGKIETFKTDIGNTISTVRNSAQEAMDEAKKTDGKIADYVTRNGLVSGTTVDTKINDATGEWSKNLSRVEGKIPTSVGGRNYLLNSGKPTALTINSNNGSVYPITKGVEDGVDWFYQTYVDGTDSFMISTYVGEVYSNKTTFGRKFSKDLEGYDGIVTYSVDVMSPEPIMLRLNLSGSGRDSQTKLVPNQWARLITTMPITDYPRPMAFIADVNDNVGIPAGTKVYWKNYKIEKGNIATDYSLAPEDNYTQQDFKIFEASYNSSVEGIDAKLGTVSNKVDDNGKAFTEFKENEYKRTADRVSDTFTKSETTTMLGGKADASQLTNYLAKSTYERDAEQSKERFETIESDLDNISVGGRNYVYKDSVRGNSLDLFNTDNYPLIYIKPTPVSITAGIRISDKLFEIGETYTLSFTIQNLEDGEEIYQLGGHSAGFETLSVTMDGVEYNGHWNIAPIKTSLGYDEHKIIVKLKFTGNSGDSNLYIQPNRGGAEFKRYHALIKNLNINKGTVVTDWSPAVEDMANVSYVNSEITKSANAITTSLSNYARTTDLNGLATETYATNQAVSEAGKVKNELTKYAKTTDLTGLASETYATNVAVSEAGKVSNELTKYAKTTALTGLATETYAQTQATTEAGKVEQKLTGYAKTTDLNGLATETYATNKAVSEAGKVSSELTKYELKTGVDSKISTASSALRTETAEKMKTVYTKTETETLLGKKADSSTLNNYVQQATYESGIDGVSQSLSRVEGKVDGIEFGGRNLIKRSDFDNIVPSGVSGVAVLDEDYQNGLKVTGGNNQRKNYLEFPGVLSGNGWYTVSFLARGTQNRTRGLSVVIGDSPALTDGRISNTSNEYTYHTYSYKVENYNSETNNSIKIAELDYAYYRIDNIKLEKGNKATDWSPAPEDTLTQTEYKAFKSDYESTVKGITGQITTLSTNKLDGSTYTNFLSNDYKTTAERATSAFTKVNKIIDANGNSTDAFAKAVYDRNATRQSADFKEVTKDLVKTATYTAGINGINNSISSVEGKIDDLSGARNLLKQSWHNSEDSPAIISTEYGIKSWNLEKPLEVGKTYTFRLFGFSNRDFFVLYTPNGMMSLVSGMSNGDSSVIRTDNPYNGLKNRRIWEKTFTLSQAQYNNMVANKVVLYNYPSSNSGNGEVYWATLVEGTAGIDWSPALTDNLGKAEFTVFKNEYDETDKEVKRRLLAIDSGKKGSVLYNANEALSTAQGNTRSITSLNTKVDGLKIGGRNLISGTDDLTNIFGSGYGGSSIKYHKDYEVSDAEWGKTTKATRVVITKASGTSGVFTTANHFKMIFGKPYTLSFYVKNLGQYRIQFNLNGLMLNPDGTGGQSIYVNGGESGKFSATGYMRNNPEWNWFQILPAPTSGVTTMDFAIAYLQVEEGNFATDWTPALADQMGKADFTLFKNEYEDTSSKILNRLTAIDSSAEGSVVTRLNQAIKTADENSNTISKVNNIVTIQDTRDDNQPPSWYRNNYPKATVQEFKLTTAIRDSNIPSTSGYGILSTTIVWNHTSGGTIQQVFTQNDKRYTRRGWTDDTGWMPWIKMTDQEDIKNFVDSTSTEYQTIRERSNLYERVIGSSTEAGMKEKISRVVMTDSVFQTEVIDRQNLLTAMASGTGMTSDPYFDKGNNGIVVYDNGKTGTISITRQSTTGTGMPAPVNKPYRLAIYHGASTATNPNRGGIAKQTNGWANGTVVVKFTAFLPVGRSFNFHNNSMGTGYSAGWLTDNKGTGKWETYMYYYRFGTGTISNFGHLSVDGASTAFNWYLSEYDIINVNETSASKITQLADNINLKVSKSDLISQINVQAGGVLITSGTNKLNVTPTTTYIENGTIKSAMIESIKANQITTGVLDASKITVNNLSASSITTGVFDASKFTVKNLDASSITANQAELVKAGLKGSSGGTLELTGDQFLSTSSDGSQVYLQNGVMGVRRPTSEGGGSIGQIGYVYDGGSPTYTIQTSWGSHFALKQRFYDSYTKLTKDKRAMYISTGDDGVTTMQFYAKDFVLQGDRNLRFGYDHYINGIGNDLTLTGKESVTVRANERTIFVVSSNGKNNYASMYANLNMQGNTVTNTSDIRLKRDIVNDEIDSLSALMKWQHAGFNYINLNMNQERQFSVIAQSAPDIAFTGEDGYLQVALNKQVNMTSHALQQLGYKVIENDNRVSDKIKELENKITMLELELKRARG